MDRVAQGNSVLALDLGTTTGWSIGSADGLITSGTVNFKGGRFEGGGMRFLRFKRWVEEMRELNGFKEVVYEEVRRHLSTDAAHVYGGFLSHLTTLCELWEIPYVGVPVGTIKKFATGKGNADKDSVMAAVRDWGFCPKDDNEADALALLKCRLSGKI